MSENKQGIKVLVAGAILQLFLGIIYVWSVFVEPVANHLSWDKGSVKLTSSFMLCFFAIGILLGGKIQAKIGTSKVVLMGGLLMAAGILATSFIPASANFMVYITYGVIGGLGVGMAYNAVISCVPRWFPEKRGLVTGISVFSFGFATVLFAPLVKTLIASFEVVTTFRILSAVFLVVSVLLFRFIVLPETNTAAAAQLGEGKQYTTGEMMKTPQFYLIAIAMMVGTAAYFVLNPSFVTLPEERGMSAEMATMLVMFTGIANALGRLAVPLLSDKIGREKAGICVFAAMALCAGLLVFANGALLFAAIAVIVFCYGGTSGLFPLITGKYFGLKHQGSNYGMVMIGFAISALVFPIIMGGIESDLVKYISMAVIAAVGIVIFFVLPNLKQAKVGDAESE